MVFKRRQEAALLEAEGTSVMWRFKLLLNELDIFLNSQTVKSFNSCFIVFPDFPLLGVSVRVFSSPG